MYERERECTEGRECYAGRLRIVFNWQVVLFGDVSVLKGVKF